MSLAQGEYPVFLLKAWDSFAKTHPVENDRPGTVCVCVAANMIALFHCLLAVCSSSPDSFPEDQLYVVMAAENAGSSLESYQVTINGDIVST